MRKYFPLGQVVVHMSWMMNYGRKMGPLAILGHLNQCWLFKISKNWASYDLLKLAKNHEMTYNLLHSQGNFHPFSNFAHKRRHEVHIFRIIMKKEWAQGDKNWPIYDHLKSHMENWGFIWMTCNLSSSSSSFHMKTP